VLPTQSHHIWFLPRRRGCRRGAAKRVIKVQANDPIQQTTIMMTISAVKGKVAKT